MVVVLRLRSRDQPDSADKGGGVVQVCVTKRGSTQNIPMDVDKIKSKWNTFPPWRACAEMASGDLGAPAYRKFDLEAWMPGRGEGGEWGEITSASNCTDFQARRLKTRYRPSDGGKPEVLHTLNGTAISNARAILALLEIHQQPDGSVLIPEPLRPYMGGMERIEPKS